ncbi:Coenzyme F420 hydrogenase/dehydrogenase, beta subunit C-terminal domain [Frigidibacter oleivorans]|uniref:Coenzyme F420 hydrogenase/dehydrogenase, beta subunit C-terminal domain n=1 Tax=Frigidibacter oleivorans TaxID=2487129 RepID=UPI000F8C9407|nr:Coenzyme F420 hydrogenase/dehydrogenase, beta subunit C-terminal domain [Frigidibacter oleivorans]
MSLKDEIAPVIAGGFCVGCGACAVAAPEAISMVRDLDGVCQPQIRKPALLDGVAGGVCPFSDAAPDEDAHARRLFPGDVTPDAHLGRYRRTLAGHAAETDFRQGGSSGGVTTWVLVEALRQNKIDAVVHVHPAAGGALFDFDLARTEDEIRSGAKTRYYSVSFETALRCAVDAKLRIAFVGVPCFVKAVRNLAARDPDIAQQVVLTVAIICGHMKSPGFAESLAWQAGVPPDDIAAVDFRVKRPGHSAKQYGFSVKRAKDAATLVKPMGEMAGRRWDGGYFRLKACNFCDDVVGETADISFGDAWLKEYDGDPGGTNVIVVRSDLADALIHSGQSSGALDVHDLPPERAIASQSAGFRDRRDALAYRLWLADHRGGWRPQKRVQPGRDHLTFMRRVIYRIRGVVRVRSFASLRLSKRLGSPRPYVWEMTFWHAILRLAGDLETLTVKISSRRRRR